MKNFVKIFVLTILAISNIYIVFWATTNNCWEFESNELNSLEISNLLDDCKPEWVVEMWTSNSEEIAWGAITSTTNSNDWYRIEDVKDKIYSITQKVVVLATILAIWWLVYAWILFTTSYWDDSKNKKAKEATKWSLIWLVAAIVSQQLINAVINFIYWVSG